MNIEKIKKIKSFSKVKTKSTLLEFMSKMNFNLEEHKWLYEQTMLRVTGKYSRAFFEKRYGPELEFTRVRINCTPGTLFVNKCDIGCPPDNVVSLGRANLSGKSVFYCSDVPGTSIFEVRPKEGDWITTTTFKYSKEEVRSLALGVDATMLDDYEKLPPYLQGIHQYYQEIFEEAITDSTKHEYYKTAILCKSLFGNGDAITYPSVASQLLGRNYVFTREHAEKHMIFEESRTQQVIQYESDTDFKVRCLYTATELDEYDDLVWKKNEDCEGHKISKLIYEH